MNISDYKKIIRERMGDYRFSHSVNVAKEAKKLAKHYGADENKAEIAGILHDITKEMPKEQQLQIIIDSGSTSCTKALARNERKHCCP